MKIKILSVFLLIIFSTISSFAQTTEFTYQGRLNGGGMAANGNYDLEFRLFDVAANGSALGTIGRLGVTVTNGSFTVGQTLAGTNSTGGTYNLRGGFWASPSLAPTAATVSLSGRITLDRPGFMQNVRITLQNLSTGVIYSTNPSSFGIYRFEELEIGSYLIQAEGGNFQFNPSSFVITLLDNLEDVNFTGEKIF